MHEVIKMTSDAKLVNGPMWLSLSYIYTDCLKILAMMYLKYKHNRNSYMRAFRFT